MHRSISRLVPLKCKQSFSLEKGWDQQEFIGWCLMHLLFSTTMYVWNDSLLSQINIVMTIREVIASGYDSSQFMIIKHLDSWFAIITRTKTKCVSGFPIYTRRTLLDMQSQRETQWREISKRGLSHILKGCNELSNIC